VVKNIPVELLGKFENFISGHLGSYFLIHC
jgi:hypothetical protein